ncbi:UNVERIFIED_CONTAM: protein NRT1/ PTR FAMILY 3.1 [Sesamum latifolium]|uniref:Protein NRT1/ PTR FAMILY 3.1 n=1 Tax=Sesamum latifolium TaxID=2727402 RepID=A0AAW2YCX6_9LAMI
MGTMTQKGPNVEKKHGGIVTMPFIFGHDQFNNISSTAQFKASPCKNNQVCKEADSGQLAVLYVSLLLTALGSGGIRPCVVSFGADQFDENDPKQKTATWSFFNWYYFCMGASIVVANTVIVYIQDNVGWGWGLGVPTIAMALSIIGFIFGYPLYREMDPAGSPFTRLMQVSVWQHIRRGR